MSNAPQQDITPILLFISEFKSIHSFNFQTNQLEYVSISHKEDIGHNTISTLSSILHALVNLDLCYGVESIKKSDLSPEQKIEQIRNLADKAKSLGINVLKHDYRYCNKTEIELNSGQKIQVSYESEKQRFVFLIDNAIAICTVELFDDGVHGQYATEILDNLIRFTKPH